MLARTHSHTEQNNCLNRSKHRSFSFHAASETLLFSTLTTEIMDGLRDRQTDELHKPMLSYLIHSPSLHLSPPPWEDPAHCGGAYITLADHFDSITAAFIPGAALHHHTHQQAVIRGRRVGESGGDVEHRRRCRVSHHLCHSVGIPGLGQTKPGGAGLNIGTVLLIISGFGTRKQSTEPTPNFTSM